MKGSSLSSTAALPHSHWNIASVMRNRSMRFGLLATVFVIANLFFVSGVIATTYYSNNADPSNANNWWFNTNGTGTLQPSNLTTAGDVFILQIGQTCVIVG